MKLTVVKITPEIATNLLNVNTQNRQFRRAHINYWKSCLIGNAVTLTHQGIAIAGTLDNPILLLDGQHRLKAIQETGISMVSVLCENCPLGAFDNMDNGMPRSMANRAKLTSGEAQMASAFYYYSRAGMTEKPPVKLIQNIHDLINPYAKYVVNERKKSLSLVPIRAAFVVQQGTKGTNMSQEFQTGQFGVMTESLNALYRRQSTRPIGIGGGCSAQAAFCATWRAIARPSLTKVVPPAAPSEEAAYIIETQFPEVFQLIKNFNPNQ